MFAPSPCAGHYPGHWANIVCADVYVIIALVATCDAAIATVMQTCPDKNVNHADGVTQSRHLPCPLNPEFFFGEVK